MKSSSEPVRFFLLQREAVLCSFNNRRSRDANELEVVVGLDEYNVPANVRSAVNHGLTSAPAANIIVSKEATRIRFLQTCFGVHRFLFTCVLCTGWLRKMSCWMKCNFLTEFFAQISGFLVEEFFKGHVRTVPGNIQVKFEGRVFNHFGAISIYRPKI